MAEASTQGRAQTRRKLPRRSKVWKDFVLFTDAEGKEKARCKHCSKELDASQGTSNAQRHVEKCSAQEAAAEGAGAARQPQQQQPLPPPCVPSRHGGSSDRDRSWAAPSSSAGSRGSQGQEPGLEGSRDLARMIALHGYDPLVVEDDYFLSFVRGLSPEFKVPSRVDIEQMCDGIFDEARRDSLSRIRRAPGRLSFAVGEAKTIQAGEVWYIACHFIDDEWKLHKMVTDAFVLEDDHLDSHAGPILGITVTYDAADYANDIISDQGHRLLTVVCDDINDSINYDTTLGCATTTYVDNVLHSIARCLLPCSEFTDEMFGTMMGLHLTRQERLQLLSELGLDHEWAYDEHWCVCYSSLEVLRKRRGFTALEVVDLFVKLLCKVWEQVYRGIQRISASTCPTSNLCLAELLKLREILQPELARFSGDDADVQDKYVYDYFEDGDAGDVLRKVSNTLDKAIQDSYLVWSVPLALDPRYKLEYIEFSFERAFGSEEATKYVSQVTAKINKLYADYIKEYGTITGADHSDTANAMMATASVHPWEQAWNERRRSQDVMAAQVNSGCPETQTELDRYLRDPLAPEDFDVLNWWKENSQKYPMVARMARDALAMPTCSKLSSDQLAQVRSILRGYSQKPYEGKWL